MKILINTFLFVTLLTAHAQTPPLTGKVIFQNNCVKCHGEDGTKGRWGAANLRDSRLPDDAMLNVISNGRGWFMPKWGKKFTPAQIETIIAYIKTLRK